MEWLLSKQTFFFFAATISLGQVTRADFIPIALTSDSFNQDVVVEKAAPPPLLPATTASMENGTANTGYGWYEAGYYPTWPATGLPAAGSTYNFTDYAYQMAPSYKSNNAAMIDSTLPSATLAFTTPAAFSRLSFLTASGNGPGNVQFTVHYQNGTTQTGTLTCPDWLSTVNQACIASGRVDVNSFMLNGVNLNQPALFAKDIVLSNTNSPVTLIGFNYIAGAALNAIFAVSGSTNQVDPFNPIVVTGFNVDLVVESSAARRERLIGATSASMEGGTFNAKRTWYEQGYYPLSPATGLPVAGSILTNSAAPDHRYTLPASYTANNAALVDSDFPNASLAPISPSAYTALSFLCAAGHGPVTNECIITHANGSSQTNALVIPNWFDGTPAAFVSSGDIDLDIRAIDSAGANNPRLYSVDIPLANTVSAVTGVNLTFKAGPSNSHAAIFAISGSTSQDSVTKPVLSISMMPGGNLRIGTTQPGRLQSTTAFKEVNTVWQDEGAISSTITIVPAPGIKAKFYRVLGQ